jgi:hypothetical protein
VKRQVVPQKPGAATAYEKVSATLDRNVLRMIRERTPNVSAFLNEAARDKLYFQMIDETIAELDRQGVKRDEKMYAWLGKTLEELERKRGRARAR